MIEECDVRRMVRDEIRKVKIERQKKHEETVYLIVYLTTLLFAMIGMASIMWYIIKWVISW